MKKILSSILALIMVLQLGFVVSTKEEKLIYELNAGNCANVCPVGAPVEV